MSYSLDLSPARWIWAPYGRTLPNTFVLFKKLIRIDRPVRSARGRILACSRYVLKLNGERVQFGPAPCDPRFEEADPLDLTERLRNGMNEMEVRVVYFGHGEGTWVSGRAGLIFKLEIEYEDGTAETVVSDENTLYAPDESHPAGQYKRWYLRALQEEYDARKDVPVYRPAKVLPGRADKPSSMNGNTDYLYDAFPAEPENSCIRAREIPMPEETFVPAAEMADAGIVRWLCDPDDWFRFRREDCFVFEDDLSVEKVGQDAYRAVIPEDRAICLTFRMPEGASGFVDFEIDAPEGTVVEAMIQEGHDPAKTRWLDTQFFNWTRFICREGSNHFVSFDYESYAWLQLHIRGTAGTVTVRRPGMLRRRTPLPEQSMVTDDPVVDRVLKATINTLRNSSVETFIDGVARERQQYSGDCQHQLDLFSFLYGAVHPSVKRFYETYGDGLSLDGYFIDSWPAYDRINRLGQAQIGMTSWTSILDHSLIFLPSFFRWEKQSGDYSLEEKMIPRFRKLIVYLKTLCLPNGLIDSTRRTNTFFWMDPICYDSKKDRMCCANILLYNTLKCFAAELDRLGDGKTAVELTEWAERVKKELLAGWYDPERKLFFDDPETGKTSDYTLGAAIMYDLLPDPSEAVKVLIQMPDYLKMSYPANAVWRIRALGKAGRADVIMNDIRTRWAGMPSVETNNTLAEYFMVNSDTNEEWSHCPVSPALAMFECCGGMTYTKDTFTLRPNDGGLKKIDWTAILPEGKLHFILNDGVLTTEFPDTLAGEIVLPNGETIKAISGEPIRIC